MKTRKMRGRARVPLCTHINMDRVYGYDQQCQVCGRPPSIGFLYGCRQDWVGESLHDILTQQSNDATPLARSSLRLQLEATGLSESVITTAELGAYTDAQLKRLKAQKKELRQAIEDAIQGSQMNKAVARLSNTVQRPSHHDGTISTKSDSTAAQSICTVQACHSCRPYYRDRVPISIQSVLSGAFPPLTQEDMVQLPTRSAQIMKTIGISVNASHSSTASNSIPLTINTSASRAISSDAPPSASTSNSESSKLTFKTTQTDLDDLSAQKTPRRGFYKVGHRRASSAMMIRQHTLLTRQGLKAAVKDMFRPGRASSSSGSNITLPLARTGALRGPDGSADVGEFDLPALRKTCLEEGNEVSSHHGHEAVQSHSLGSSQKYASPRATSTSHTSVSSSDAFSMYTCLSEGHDIETDGGIALTDEEIDMYTRDGLMNSKARENMGNEEKGSGINPENKKEEEDEDCDNLGLQSIIAQV